MTTRRRKNGTGTLRADGYLHVQINGVRNYQHIFLAEKALGKKLPSGAMVHHVDENRQNNDPKNLVICPSQAYHQLLHKRQKAFEDCGNPSFERCRICSRYDSIENLNGGPTRKDIRRYHKGKMREICNFNKSLNI